MKKVITLLLILLSFSVFSQSPQIDEKTKEWINTSNYISSGNFIVNGNKIPFVFFINLDHEVKETKIIYHFTKQTDLLAFLNHLEVVQTGIDDPFNYKETTRFQNLTSTLNRDSKSIVIENRYESSKASLTFAEIKILRGILSKLRL
jgi:hypothetical protein